MRIHTLSTAVANQIAAGEVIERPASVVKELLENALDARAQTVDIVINGGGLTYISIRDDGCGIDPDDLHLAIAPHATSKLTVLQDLYAIASMGFRGEALASIASVSRLRIQSKIADQSKAMMLSHDEEGTQITPCARTVGTTVDVSDLFYNAPVRKRFLSSDHNEYVAIETMVKRFALSTPEMSIHLQHNEKSMLHVVGAYDEKTRLHRLQRLIGKPFVDHAIPIAIEHANIKLHGWCSAPSYQRSQTDRVCLYVNQRMVKDKLLLHAIKQAYAPFLDPGRHPVCVLYLTLPADQLDVNVHPTKHEVRFQEPRIVHDMIVRTIAEALDNKERVVVLMPSSSLSAVRELSPKYSVVSEAREARPWIRLHTQFVLVFLQDNPYILDLLAIERARLRASLMSMSLPLPHRPLLVPLRCVVPPTMEHTLSLLADVGIQVEWIGEREVRVCTVPLNLPQLDIHKLIQEWTVNPGAPDLMIDRLLDCITIDAANYNFDDQQALVSYLESSHTVRERYCARLDEQRCKELVRG